MYVDAETLPPRPVQLMSAKNGERKDLLKEAVNVRMSLPGCKRSFSFPGSTRKVCAPK